LPVAYVLGGGGIVEKTVFADKRFRLAFELAVVMALDGLLFPAPDLNGQLVPNSAPEVEAIRVGTGFWTTVNDTDVFPPVLGLVHRVMCS